MRHFLFEFITGGGLSDQDLPESLIQEAEIMIQTLLKELSEVDEAEISICRDKRVSKVNSNTEQIIIYKQPIEEELLKLLTASDVAWLIAPETDACLFSLAKLFGKHGRIFIGSNPSAIKICTSKLETNKALQRKNIKTVATQKLDMTHFDSDTGWIIKPDDGAGAEACYFIKQADDLSAMICNDKYNNIIIQPFIKGESVSMSLLVMNDDVRLLSCNKQYIDIENGKIRLVAIGVNECIQYQDSMMQLAKEIISAIPGLAGYIGVDMIVSNNEFFVLDINPRLTTAYAGLSESLGCNITVKILNSFLQNTLPNIELDNAKPVKINL